MGKVCVVTGGANGIGRCIAEKFIAQDYQVAIIDTDEEAGADLTRRFGSDRILFYHGDVSKSDNIENFVSLLILRYKTVDVLINNACYGKGGLESCSYDDFNEVLRAGVTAPFYLTKLLTEHFAQDASIVNISSTRAFMSQPDTESYTAAKGGITALTHALCITLAGRVRVNSISPGWIDTRNYHLNKDAGSILPNDAFSTSDIGQHPAGRVGKPEDIAEMAFFLCSEKSGFITGENVIIDGGMSRQMIYHNDYGWKFER